MADTAPSLPPGKAPARTAPGFQRLLRRADYLRVAAGSRQPAPGFLLQARARLDDPAAPPRLGITCSRKLGNAVMRNRARRRLRALARAWFAAGARPGWDYVLVGRPGATVSRPFALLAEDLARALARLHGGGGEARR